MSKAIDKMCNAIMSAIKFETDKLTYDKTYQGRVINNLGNGLYKVLIYNQEYKVKSETGRSNIPAGSTVKVVAPQNNFSEIFIY